MTVDTNDALVGWKDPDLERSVVDEVSLEMPWPTVEKLGSLVRTSGAPQEREAVDFLISQLCAIGDIPFTLHQPECFISVPLGATLRIDEPGGKSFRAKTVVMSVSTDGHELSGQLVSVPSTGGRLAGALASGIDVTGKVILTTGRGGPGAVSDAMAAGASAAVFINPGEYIHEGLCTTIWGTPDLDSNARQPTIPVLNVSHSTGDELTVVAERGGRVALSTTLEQDWRPIPVLVAEVPGAQIPDEFVLVHGHLDGWHYGVGDNATGDATLVELARVFWQHRDQLTRSLRLAWWSGHSHGRYAGSTWYADNFAIDLARNCVAQVNCDSPGCRWADTYNPLTVMTEAVPFVKRAITETTGISPEPARPLRAGDYSFNSIGISSMYMLSSTMSEETRRQHDFYPVGGCGGNIQWHTEDDTMQIADRDNLLRDIRMYAVSLLRTLNAPLHPFDWSQTTAEFRQHLKRYDEAAGDLFAFAPAFTSLSALEASLQRFYASAPVGLSANDPKVARFNFAQRRLARLLVRANFSRMPEFWHDPAVNVPPLPDLEPALRAGEAKGDPHQTGILKTHLIRGQNRLVWTLEQAREIVEAAMA